uniref:Actin n=1 Tax=Macrostomum lignano TaxID=282301 RepID=A0A1I8F3X8_9PLAT
ILKVPVSRRSLTIQQKNPTRNREKTAEIFFETLGVPGLFMSMQAVLSLYATGRTTGVVLDSGDGVTHAVPIYEGFALQHAVMRTDIAGRDVTRYLQLLLRKEGACFHTSAELEIVRQVKERACYVSANPVTEEKLDPERVTYSLPDGSQLEVNAAAFRAPELLFRPELVGEEWEGIHEVLAYSIQRSDMDLRRLLYANIVVSGGSTLIRRQASGGAEAPGAKDNRLKISAPQERLYSTWIGGSILAALDTFRRMWVSKKEYDEEGARSIHRKTF